MYYYITILLYYYTSILYYCYTAIPYRKRWNICQQEVTSKKSGSTLPARYCYTAILLYLIGRNEMFASKKCISKKSGSTGTADTVSAILLYYILQKILKSGSTTATYCYTYITILLLC